MLLQNKETLPKPEEILAKLNPGQLAVATSKYGVHVGVAGPGTGKTTAQNACASMKFIDGMDPSNIASITFTNKAAEEMRSRFVDTIGTDGYKAFIGTFHQLSLKKILRANIKNDYFVKGKYPNGFSIVDASDSKVLLRNAYKSCSEKVRSLMEIAKVDEDAIKTLIGLEKGKGNNAEHFFQHIPGGHYLVGQIANNEIGDSEGEINRFIQQNPESKNLLIWFWWAKYEDECTKNEVMDFDDILLHSLKLMERDPSVSKKLGFQFQHVQVDEYQDTNEVQFQILRNIIDNQKEKSLLIVGDMRQAIYGFRGADSESMNKAVKYFNANIISMNINYRTTEKSIEAINQFGETMSNQLTKGILQAASGRIGIKTKVHAFETDYEEANYIIKDVKEKLSSGVLPNEIAIIYRGKAASKTLKGTLGTEKIQFETVGDTDFYSMKEVKVTMALMRLLVNANDRFALYQLMDEIPIGITKANLGVKASEAGITPMAFLKDFAVGGGVRGNKAKDLLNGIEDISSYVPFLTDEEMAACMNLNIQQYHDQYAHNSTIREKSDNQMAQFISEVTPMFSVRILEFFDSVISDNFHKKAEKAFIKKNSGATNEEINEHVTKAIEKRRERVTKLSDILSKTIKDGASYKEAVDELLLLADNTKNNKVGSIFLMTGHASKGLEYAHTYFLGAEQGSFFRDSDPDESVISEEERLFYVGTTRHKESLQITRCNTRFVNGETKCFEPLEMLTRLAGTVDNFDWTIKGKENTARSRDSKRHQAPSNNISSNSSEASKKLRTALNQSHSKNEAGTTSGSQEKEGEMSSSDSFKAKIEQKKIKNHNKLNPDDESIIEDHSITNGLLFTL